ncbi:MAG: patatin-like phospholipase family protein [Holosporaceae bacterium]|jgi:hypothetical protein|nr:patatin-like phospholipase family protein [Holosporaceae bacterium]
MKYKEIVFGCLAVQFFAASSMDPDASSREPSPSMGQMPLPKSPLTQTAAGQLPEPTNVGDLDQLSELEPSLITPTATPSWIDTKRSATLMDYMESGESLPVREGETERQFRRMQARPIRSAEEVRASILAAQKPPLQRNQTADLSPATPPQLGVRFDSASVPSPKIEVPSPDEEPQAQQPPRVGFASEPSPVGSGAERPAVRTDEIEIERRQTPRVMFDRNSAAPPKREPLPRYEGAPTRCATLFVRKSSREDPPVRRKSINVVAIERRLQRTMTKFIVSLDGGGCRGVTQAFYLVELMRLCGGNLPVNMVAGASVGALNGTALALGKMEELYRDYSSLVDKIFTPKRGSMGAIRKPLYRNKEKLQVFKDIIGDCGAKQVAEDRGIDMVIPFFDCSSKTPKVFMSFDADQIEMQLVDLLMMTSSAPTFFNPHVCETADSMHYEGADGGLFVNNPAILAALAARQRYPDCRLVLLSIGTGSSSTCEEIGHCRNRGLAWWASEISDITIDGGSIFTSVLLDSFIDVIGLQEYVRIQTPLPREAMKLDGRGQKNDTKLRTAARANIRVGGQGYESFQKSISVVRAIQEEIQRYT